MAPLKALRSFDPVSCSRKLSTMPNSRAHLSGCPAMCRGWRWRCWARLSLERLQRGKGSASTRLRRLHVWLPPVYSQTSSAAAGARPQRPPLLLGPAKPLKDTLPLRSLAPAVLAVPLALPRGPARVVAVQALAKRCHANKKEEKCQNRMTQLHQ